MKLYIESSIINFVFETIEVDKAKITKDFFNKTLHKLFVSELVLEEIEKTKSEKKDKMVNFILNHKIKVLKLNEKAEKLALKYVEAGLVPERYTNDALHIELAVINNMDVVVSWNMEHIVKLKTISGVNKINKEVGYPTIYINTPEEVIE